MEIIGIIALIVFIVLGILGVFSNKKEKKETTTSGIESQVFEEAKKRDWIRGELEFQHQYDNLKIRGNPDDNITLGRLLNILDISKDEIGDMYVVSQYLEMQGQLIQDLEQVWNYDLCSAILQRLDDGEYSTKFAEQVILSIWYKRNKNELEMDGCYTDNKYNGTNDLIIVHLRDSGNYTTGSRRNDSYYICATVCIPPFAWTKQKMAITEYERLQGTVVSITFAFDVRNPEQKLEEFKYYRDDTLNKIQANKEDELSDIQRYILDNIRENIGKDFYFGKKAMEKKCFGNAIEYFQNIFEHFNSEYFNHEMSDNEIYYFYDSCYQLGSCFCELGLYEKALYYLDISWRVDNVKYKSEYINCLIMRKDYRAFYTVKSEIERIAEIERCANELSDNYKEYYQFLKRRKIYLFIEKGFLEEAEKLLKDMLDQHIDEDFVLGELAYIQRIKNEKNE